MSIYRLSHPFDALDRLQRDLDRVAGSPFPFPRGLSGRGAVPAINVFEDAQGYVVRAEVAGVAPEDVSVQTEGRTLTIEVKRETDIPEGAGVHRRERRGGKTSRAIQLPEDLDLTKSEAAYKHGMLTIRIPKREEAKPRSIAVHAA